jgi:hypothetical protein
MCNFHSLDSITTTCCLSHKQCTCKIKLTCHSWTQYKSFWTNRCSYFTGIYKIIVQECSQRELVFLYKQRHLYALTFMKSRNVCNCVFLINTHSYFIFNVSEVKQSYFIVEESKYMFVTSYALAIFVPRITDIKS